MFSSKSQVERRIVRRYWDDGLLDILAGVVTLLIALAWHFELVPLGALAPVVVIPFWKPMRAWITEPRLGHVELSDAQEGRYRSFLRWSCGIGCVTFLAAVLTYFFVVTMERDTPQQQWVAAIPAWAFAMLALLTSLVILVRRFVGYAAIFLVLGICVVAQGYEPEFAMFVGGSAVTVIGLLRLLAFVRSHPSQPLGMNGA